MINEKTVLPFAIAAVLVVGAVYFLLRKTISDAAGAVAAGAGAVNDVRLAVASDIGEHIFTWFHPNPTVPDVYFPVTFPDGSKHMISARDVDSNGFLVGTAAYPWHDGRKYRIGIDKAGARSAVLAA